MWRRTIPTNYCLWAVIATGLFIGAGCINWVPESKTLAYWPTWLIFLTGQYGCPSEEFLFVLVMWAAMLATPSILFGWAGQAVWQVATVGVGKTSA